MTSTAIYRAMMVTLEARRLELGWSMATVDDVAGTQDGYYAKMIYPDTPTGRQAQWQTVELVVQALFGKDYEVTISGSDEPIRSAPRIDKGVSNKALQIRHWRHGAHFKKLGRLGAIAKHAKLTKEQRSAMARKMVRARWRKAKQAQRSRV